MTKLVILDLHGVILDGDYWIISRELAKRYRMKPDVVYQKLYREYHNAAAVRKIDPNHIFPFAFRDLGILENPQKAQDQHVRYTSRPKKCVLALVKRLRKQGYTVIGLSKSVPWLFDGNLKKSGVKKQFDAMINTYDLGLPKASKKTMRVIMKRFGATHPSDILYVDDQENNLVEPKKMGVNTILYKNFYQTQQKIRAVLQK